MKIGLLIPNFINSLIVTMLGVLLLFDGFSLFGQNILVGILCLILGILGMLGFSAMIGVLVFVYNNTDSAEKITNESFIENEAIKQPAELMPNFSLDKAEVRKTAKMLLLVLPLFGLMLWGVFNSPLYKSKIQSMEDAKAQFIGYISGNYYTIESDARNELMERYDITEEDINKFREGLIGYE